MLSFELKRAPILPNQFQVFRLFELGAQNSLEIKSFGSSCHLLLFRFLFVFVHFSSKFSWKMVHQCRHCSATYCNKYNRSRQENSAPPDEIELPVFQCSLCTFNARKLSLLEQHMQTSHGKFTNCCGTCNLGFNNVHLSAQHMSSLHGLPSSVTNSYREIHQLSQLSLEDLETFGTFEVVHNSDAEVNTDLARFILSEKIRIGNLVRKKLSNGPHKIHFCAKFNCSNFITVKKMALLTTSVLKLTQTHSWRQCSMVECQTKRTGLWWTKF